MQPDLIVYAVLAVIAMVLSSTVHEWAHAWTVDRLGDDTPARQGRLTLNPIAHIDPLGTLVMPALGALIGGMLIGWARPVEFRPQRFTRRITMRRGTMIVALAGPLSNVVLVFVCLGLLKLGTVAFGLDAWVDAPVLRAAGQLLYVGVWVNLVLAVFNMLPAPPLDGFKVLQGLAPDGNVVVRMLEEHQLVAFILAVFIGLRVLAGPVGATYGWLISTFDLNATMRVLSL